MLSKQKKIKTKRKESEKRIVVIVTMWHKHGIKEIKKKDYHIRKCSEKEKICVCLYKNRWAYKKKERERFAGKRLRFI